MGVRFGKVQNEANFARMTEETHVMLTEPHLTRTSHGKENPARPPGGSRAGR
jgi:hypothetical protein